MAPRLAPTRRHTSQPRPVNSGSKNHEQSVSRSNQAVHLPGGRDAEDVTRGLPMQFVRGAPPWAVSLVVHCALLITLAFMMRSSVQEEDCLVVNVVRAQEVDEIEALDEVVLETPVSLEVDELSLTPAIDPGALALGDLGPLTEIPLPTLASTANLSMDALPIDEIGAALEDPGAGMSTDGDGEQGVATFFGTKAMARRIVFVVDNSNSMTKGKLETALVELAKAISRLHPKQLFYIVFYSDTAYPLFHPQPVRTLIPATPGSKRRVYAWLNTIQMCLKTNGEEAVKLAISLQPDLIYILGDGGFTDKTAKKLSADPVSGITIHTLGMSVKSKDQDDFRAIAVTHKGTYADVGVTPAGLAMFKQYGSRPKNSKRGPVWGLKLPK